MSELKPCPFCGGPAGYSKGEVGDWVFCQANCLRIKESDAIVRWNTRPAEDALLVRIEFAGNALALVQEEVEKLRILGPDTESRVTIEARALASEFIQPAIASWRADNERLRFRLREVVQILSESLDPKVSLEAEEAALKVVERMDKLRQLADEAASEVGLYSRRMEQAQLARDRQRSDIIAWLRDHPDWTTTEAARDLEMNPSSAMRGNT